MKPTRNLLGWHTRRGSGKPEQGAGFTLIETMMSVLLCSVVLGTIISVFMAQHKSFYVGNAYIDLSREARMAMDWMTSDIRWASKLLPSHGPYSKSNSCVILELPSIDPATGDVIDVINKHDYIIYTQNGTNLLRVVYPDASSKRAAETRTAALYVGSLLFSSNGTGLGSIGDPRTIKMLDVTLTTRKTILSQNLSNTLSTAIKLRNKV